MRWATWLAWALWAFDVAVVIGMFVLYDEPLHFGGVAALLFIVVFASTGSLVASRVPSNPAGWLMSLAAVCFTIGAITGPLYSYVQHNGPQALAPWIAWVSTFVWTLGFGPSTTFLLLLFPDGRLPSRRWRPLAWVSGVSLAVSVLGLATTPGRIESTVVENPVGVPAAGLTSAMASVGLVVLLACAVGSCVSLVVRYRSAHREQRQQLKWLAWSAPVVLVCLVASVWVQRVSSSETAIDLGNALSAVGLMIVPVAIALAILRSRLYDIDVVINRTLVYGVLTATLAVVYITSVLLLRLALDPLTGQSDLAVAASTLTVAALFRPLRARIQAAVDRRFYRQHYDAVRTLDDFNTRLRQQVDLDAVSADLSSVVRDTMHPAHVTLWLRQERLP
jgi:hypothetical protein